MNVIYYHFDVAGFVVDGAVGGAGVGVDDGHQALGGGLGGGGEVAGAGAHDLADAHEEVVAGGVGGFDLLGQGGLGDVEDGGGVGIYRCFVGGEEGLDVEFLGSGAGGGDGFAHFGVEGEQFVVAQFAAVECFDLNHVV